jgi:hypothetical protein
MKVSRNLECSMKKSSEKLSYVLTQLGTEKEKTTQAVKTTPHIN